MRGGSSARASDRLATHPSAEEDGDGITDRGPAGRPPRRAALMGERREYAPGTFCWADLQTSDQQAAKAFYRSLFMWELEDTPAGEAGVYTMASIGGLDVAAIAGLQDESIPPHWSSYVAVADADAAAARARELGTAVVAEPFDVFDSGRMVVIQDPQGAFLNLWQAREHIGARLVNAPGAMSWNDLATPDPPAAAAFYGELFGWRAEEVPESDGRYWSIHNGERPNGGLMPARPAAGVERLLRGRRPRRGARDRRRGRRRSRRRADGGAGRALRVRPRPAGRPLRALHGPTGRLTHRRRVCLNACAGLRPA